MAVIKNFHQQEGLNSTKLFSHNSRDQRFKINVLNFFFYLLKSLSFAFTWTTTELIYPHGFFSFNAGTFLLSLLIFLKVTVTWDYGPILLGSFKLNWLFKAAIDKYHHTDQDPPIWFHLDFNSSLEFLYKIWMYSDIHGAWTSTY